MPLPAGSSYCYLCFCFVYLCPDESRFSLRPDHIHIWCRYLSPNPSPTTTRDLLFTNGCISFSFLFFFRSGFSRFRFGSVCEQDSSLRLAELGGFLFSLSIFFLTVLSSSSLCRPSWLPPGRNPSSQLMLSCNSASPPWRPVGADSYSRPRCPCANLLAILCFSHTTTVAERLGD